MRTEKVEMSGLESGQDEAVVRDEAIGAQSRRGSDRVAHLHDEPVVQMWEHLHVVADEECERHVRQPLRVLLHELDGRSHLRNADESDVHILTIKA